MTTTKVTEFPGKATVSDPKRRVVMDRIAVLSFRIEKEWPQTSS
jgi:hypothetical protein